MFDIRRLLKASCIKSHILYIRRAEHTGGSGEVRVRFAPSPTGDLHLGGLRTALYNFLFARNQGGKFILRIEDTDQTRLVPGAQERLIDDLLWAGIEIDEGPGFVNTFGSYIQSQRTQIYKRAAEKLLGSGNAYRCFCTESRLKLIRKEALRLRQVPRYDNKCRNLQKDEVRAMMENNMPYCIRFKLTNGHQMFEDLVYGNVEHNLAATEGDPVIIKTDGFPTYHLANVVDDHKMGITHVMRGVEWQISTPKHLMMYDAFGWQPPKFAHLPLLVNVDGSKLSKRQGDVGIRYFRDKGYFPEAVINFVVTAGGGFARTTKQLRVLRMSELAQQFSISRINSHPSRLDPQWLDEFNCQALKLRLEDPKTQTKLVTQLIELVKKTYGNNNLDLKTSHMLHVLRWATQRITYLSDLTSNELSFLWVKPAYNQKYDGITANHLKQLIDLLEDETIPFTKDQLKEVLQKFGDNKNLKFAVFMKNLRSMLSGLKQGPGVAEMMEILDRPTVLERLRDALNNISNEQQQQQSSLVNKHANC